MHRLVRSLVQIFDLESTEEMDHVEVIATMCARLLDGATATDATQNALGDPVVAAVMGGMDPQQAIITGGAPTLSDSQGSPWNGKFIVASGNLLPGVTAAGFRQRRRGLSLR